MATAEPRRRRGPDIRARINTRDEPEDYLKAQLECATRAQQAWRSRSSWHSHLGREEVANTLHRAHVALRKRTGRPQSRSRSALRTHTQDHENRSLGRTFSFNSLSTFQREAEAAEQSQWRDSPISAISRPGRPSAWERDHKPELQDPCPPLPVFTIKEQHKVEKLIRKATNEKEKKLKKFRREAAQLERDALASNVADYRFRAKQQEIQALEMAVPVIKAASTSKEKAVKLVKKLTLKRPGRKSQSRNIAESHLATASGPDHFISFEEHDINAPIPSVPGNIAELPGYSPFDDCSRAAASEPPIQLKEPPRGCPPEQETVPTRDVSQAPLAQTAHRTMRCDSCHFGIKLDEVYYHCCVCADGDRILCTACEAAGESCRHDLTEKTRQVLRFGDAARPLPDASGRTCDLRRSRDGRVRIAAPLTVDKPSATQVSSDSAGITTEAKRADDATIQIQLANKLQEVEIRGREQRVDTREREAALREREMALRLEKGLFHEREALAKDRHDVLAQQLQVGLAQQKVDLAAYVGTQFDSLKKELCETIATSCRSPVASDVERSLSQRSNTDSISLDSPRSPIFLGDQIYYPLTVATQPVDIQNLDESAIRTHGAKRKASSRSESSSAPSSKAVSKQLLRPQPRREQNSNDDEEESGSGRPKKIKQDPDAIAGPGKLFACHFCKFDRPRYSEHNTTEKHYRGCSSGYWPDISRLKQHLYRVHWRGHHCRRCFETFNSESQLKQHTGQIVACMVRECPVKEKFSELQYNEIRKKRPGNTSEEVWYIMYGILFPDAARPATPYAEVVTGAPSNASSPCPAVGQEMWETLEDIFESRLNTYQDLPRQAWLRSPGAREFLRVQLRRSMVDVIQRLSPASSPALDGGSTEVSNDFLSPSSIRRGSLAQRSSPSIPTSPVPTSATSTRSSSSGQWRLPDQNRSFSFSRPRPARLHRPTASLEEEALPNACMSNSGDTFMNGATFPIDKVTDPENDGYEGECGSWRQGDELGLALTTDDFNLEIGFGFGFDLDQGPSSASVTTTAPTKTPDVHRRPSPPPPSPRPFEFKPVKLASVADAPPEEHGATEAASLKPNRSNASIDSGYGSLGSRPSTAAPTPRQDQRKKNADRDNDDEPVPESELNLNALDLEFQDFLETFDSMSE